MENQKVNLNMGLDKINIIMAALGKMPYESVFHVIEEIRSQIGPQLAPPPSPPAS